MVGRRHGGKNGSAKTKENETTVYLQCSSVLVSTKVRSTFTELHSITSRVHAVLQRWHQEEFVRWCNPIGIPRYLKRKKKKFSAGLDVADRTESLEWVLTELQTDYHKY